MNEVADKKQEPIAQEAPPEAAQSAPAAQPDKKADVERITPGERFYDVTQFLFGKAFILAATAVLAFTAHQKYGPDKIGPFRNYLKDFQSWGEKQFAPLAKIGEEGSTKRDFGKVLAGGLTSTLILSHGGNFFSPFIKSFENNREKITNWYNKKFGTEEDVEIVHEKYKNIPKQNWWDVIKGRAAGYATVFSAVTGAYLAFGRSKGTQHHFKLDTYEDWFGRKVAWLTKGSRDIAKTPITESLTEVQKANKTYRFGKVLALDLFATSTAIIVWNMVSRLSAKNRVEEEKKVHAELHATYDTTPAPPAAEPQQTTAEKPATAHAEQVSPLNRKDMLLQGRAASYVKLLNKQQQATEQQTHTVPG